ncbi:MAG TPA: GatB/YqeY domain-containing protein [Ignavibacteriaceae bacterium]|nr:GatB/YqeY domain-containing protein [Ignavibacteriaceae bacterium]
MNLTEKINQDLKTAMKSGDKLRTETIRSIRALILEFQKSGTGKELNEEEEIKLLTGAAKKRRDSIEQYRNAGREDLATKEEKELEILQRYLPEQLNEEKIKAEVERIAKLVGAVSKQDFPKLMPAVMKELKGKADGKIIRSVVEDYLGK